jgi:hypothetical protein
MRVQAIESKKKHYKHKTKQEEVIVKMERPKKTDSSPFGQTHRWSSIIVRAALGLQEFIPSRHHTTLT